MSSSSNHVNQSKDSSSAEKTEEMMIFRQQTIIKHNLIVLNKPDEKLSVWDAIEDQCRRLNISFNKSIILTNLEQSKKHKSCSNVTQTPKGRVCSFGHIKNSQERQRLFG
jgi:hypothetical protein